MFLFISMGYHLLLESVNLGPKLFSLPILWVECDLVPTLSLSSVHASPPGQHCLDEPEKRACIPDSACLHSYERYVFFRYISECSLRNTHLLFLCCVQILIVFQHLCHLKLHLLVSREMHVCFKSVLHAVLPLLCI